MYQRGIREHIKGGIRGRVRVCVRHIECAVVNEYIPCSSTFAAGTSVESVLDSDEKNEGNDR